MKKERCCMKDRINDKIVEIEDFLEKLDEVKTDDLENYKIDLKTKAASERFAQKIVEAVVDLAVLLIKHKNFDYPESEEQAFDILYKQEIISKILNNNLHDAKKMRNIIVHEYGKVDDTIVFNAINGELQKDVNEFLESIRAVI